MGIALQDVRNEAVLVQDASGFPNHTARGGLVVADLATGWNQTYRIPIPVHVDGSYQAELYVAWEVLRVRGAHRVVWGTRGPQWSFHDSKGYIDAVQSRNPGSSPLSDDLLRACRGFLAEGLCAPKHLYSHRVGSFLDSLLDTAAGEAKRQATKAQLEVGWVRGLQEPRVCFSHNDVQVHNLTDSSKPRPAVCGVLTWRPRNRWCSSPWRCITPSRNAALFGGGHTSAQWRGVKDWDMRSTSAPAPLA